MDKLSYNEMLMWAIIDGDLDSVKKICEIKVGRAQSYDLRIKYTAP